MVVQNNDAETFTHKKVIQLILILLKKKINMQNDIATNKRGRKCTVGKKGLINPTLHVIHSL